MEIYDVSEPSNAELKQLLDQISKAQRDDARATAERFGEIKTSIRNVDDRSIETRDTVTKAVARIDGMEKRLDRAERIANEANRSSSDLSAHVKQNEEATKRAVDNLGSELRDVNGKVDRMNTEQTPLIKEIRDEQIRRTEREKINTEQVKKAVEERRETERLNKAKLDRRKTYWGIAIAILGITVPAVASYLGTRQANSDSPSHSASSEVDRTTNH